MKKQMYLYGCFIILLLFTAGCKEDDAATNPDPSGFSFGLPKVGDRADYRMISGPDTNSFYTEITQVYTNKVCQLRQTILWKFSGTEIDTQYMYVNTDEWKEVNSPSATLSGMRVFSAMELNKDYTYKLMPWSRWGDNDTIAYKLLSKTEQVTVPAGTFTCLKIQMRGVGSSQIPSTDIYFSPGHGQVKIVNQYNLVEMIKKNY